MKLIKINIDHYVVVDKTIQPVNGYYYDSFTNKIKNTNSAEYGEASHCWQITHSTQPFELSSENGLSGMGFSKVRPLNIFEVKELIGEVDVEKKAEEFITNELQIASSSVNRQVKVGFEAGYNQALEDNKDRKYTEEDVIRIVEKSRETGLTAEYLIMTFQSKTEWEVEIVDGKLKLI